MTSLIYLAATANLIAAGIDSASTIKHLTPGMELNPLARRLMRWLGMRPAVYACFALIACVTLSATAACLAIDSAALTALCASSLLLEAVLHCMAAHVNTTGGFNRWTKPLLAPVVLCYSAWDRVWSAWERRGSN